MPTYWVSVTTYVWSVPLAFWKATGDELTQAAGSFSVSSSANASLGRLLAAARFFRSFSLWVQEGLLGVKLVLLQQLSKAYRTVIAVQHPSWPPRDKQGVLLTKDYLKLLLSSSACVSIQGLCSGTVVRGLPSSGESKIHTSNNCIWIRRTLSKFYISNKTTGPQSSLIRRCKHISFVQCPCFKLQHHSSQHCQTSFSTLGYYIKYGPLNNCSEGGLAWL